jgi:precorrin-6B methylase 2
MSPLELASFVTARSSFAYRGQRLELALSQSLFSSHEVDRGSRLLLKSVGRLALPPAPAVLDLGCGTGILGIAVARAEPGSRVWFQDRDALAVSVTAHNCRANSVQAAGLSGDLALEGLGSSDFDLVVSNIPAKAGEAVHAHILRSLAARLRPGGRACVVVVAPLADRIASGIAAAGLPGEAVERASSHVVFLAGPPSTPPAPARAEPLAPYLRCRSGFAARGASYQLDAVYDLPEFDSLSHATELVLDMLEEHSASEQLRGRLLVWNPGQGHVPAYLLARRGGAGKMTLGSRDMLSLRIAARNAARAAPELVHAWDPAEARPRFSCAVIFPDDEPHVGWDAYLGELLPALLEPRGVAIVASGATFVARLLRHARGLSLLRTRKKAGARCVLLQNA